MAYERGGFMSQSTCRLFQRYLQENCLPHIQELVDSGFRRAQHEDCSRCLIRFKSWSKRLDVDKDGNLIHKVTKKRILHLDDFNRVVTDIHRRGNKQGSMHLGVVAIMGEVSTVQLFYFLHPDLCIMYFL